MNNDITTTPRADDRVSLVADSATFLTRFDVHRAFSEVQADAQAAGDHGLANAARVEINILVVFEAERSITRFGADLRQFVFATDIDYLRERAHSSPNLPARARYLHAVATLTNRQDDANAAVDALLSALRSARLVQGDSTAVANAFNELCDLYPLAFRLARRARALPRVLHQAIEFIACEAETYVHAKTRVFRMIMADYHLDDTNARRLRDPSLELLFAARGGDHGEIEAAAQAGRRLAERLGESHVPWLEAEASALEDKLQYNQHPMLVQMVGNRLLRIYGLLGDETRMSAAIQRNRTAAASVEYQTIHFTLDDDGTSEEQYRTCARRVYAQNGSAGALAAIAAGPIVPTVSAVRANVEQLSAQGVGVYRQIAQIIVSADERVIAENPPDQEFDEQYDIAWTIAAQVHGFMFEEFLAAGLTLDEMESFLRGSWMGREEGIDEPNDLVDLLVPCFRLYLAVLDDDHWMRIPAIDSLAMRFESVVRKLARLLDVPHVRATGGGNRALVEHAGLRLLDHPRIAEVVGEDLIAYAKHTLMREPEGLRDRVGHALLHRGGYRLDDLHALFILYMRFAALQWDQGAPPV